MILVEQQLWITGSRKQPPVLARETGFEAFAGLDVAEHSVSCLLSGSGEG